MKKNATCWMDKGKGNGTVRKSSTEKAKLEKSNQSAATCLGMAVALHDPQSGFDCPLLFLACLISCLTFLHFEKTCSFENICFLKMWLNLERLKS